MELKKTNTLANMIPLVLKMVSKYEFEEEDFYFIYGQEEYT